MTERWREREIGAHARPSTHPALCDSPRGRSRAHKHHTFTQSSLPPFLPPSFLSSFCSISPPSFVFLTFLLFPLHPSFCSLSSISPSPHFLLLFAFLLFPLYLLNSLHFYIFQLTLSRSLSPSFPLSLRSFYIICPPTSLSLSTPPTLCFFSPLAM